MEISTIGLDLAKSIFQVHAVDAAGEIVARKALRRAQVLPFFAKLPPCLIGMEACGTSHHWARELTKLGHEVRLMPPAYVKPYVKRGKHPLPAGYVQKGDTCVKKPVVVVACTRGKQRIFGKCIEKPEVSSLCKKGFKLVGKSCVRIPVTKV